MKNALKILTVSLAFTVSCLTANAQSNKNDTLQLFGNKWTAYDISDRRLDVSSDVMPYMIFSRDGRVSGFSGCNRFFGDFGIDGKNISLSNIGMTRMLCVGDANQIENDFAIALQQINNYSINGGTLTLYNDTNPIIKLQINQ